MDLRTALLGALSVFAVSSCSTPSVEPVAARAGISRAPASDFAANSAREDALEALSADPALRFRTLSRSIWTYHYFRVEDGANVEAAGFERLKTVVAGFWDSPTGYGLVGEGVYAARDPRSSASFGGGADGGGGLIAIQLPKGTRLFDIRAQSPRGADEYQYGNDVFLSESSRAALRRAGCSLPRQTRLLALWGTGECGEIFKELFRRMNVSAILHSWYQGGIPGCLNHPDTFVIIDGRIVSTPSLVNVFGATSLAKDRRLDPQNSRHQLLARILRYGAGVNAGGDRSDVRVTDRELDAWRDETIFHCTEDYPEEKVAVEPPNSRIYAVSPDSDPSRFVPYESEDGVIVSNIEWGKAASAQASYPFAACGYGKTCVVDFLPRVDPAEFAEKTAWGLTATVACGTKADAKKAELRIAADAYGARVSIECAKGQAPRISYAALPYVRVESATYGANAGGAAGNATKLAQAFCDGRRKCTYKVAYRFLKEVDPDPKSKEKSFSIQWRCSKAGEIQSQDLPSDAHGKTIDLDCSKDGAK